MTVAELIEELKKHNPNMTVRISQEECSAGCIDGLSTGRRSEGRNPDGSLKLYGNEILYINSELETTDEE